MEFKPFKQGKYVLLERLASGGMAEVYRAKADGAGGFVKQLAVKRILPNYSQNDEFQKMFEYEARLSSQLTHANIVQIYDFIQSGDMYLLAMEFVDGKNLRQFINKAKKANVPIPIPFSVYVVNEASKGLDYAHKKKDDLKGQPLNIIHRDMSPQNIMCSYEGAIKIVDFGIAKAKDKVDETRSGVIKGKFGYMSPEQANGDSVDSRSDIFSTVIILWEMLTGKRLFAAENDLATLKMIQDCQIMPPSKINPNVKPELERIILKGLTKDQSLRYPEAGALSRDLQSYLARFYPTFSQRDVSDVLTKVFKEEIEIEKKRWEEALRQSITFSQGGNTQAGSVEKEGFEGDITRSETGSETVVTGGVVPMNDPGAEPGGATLISKKEHTLMDFETAGEVNNAMMTLEDTPPEVNKATAKPPAPPPSAPTTKTSLKTMNAHDVDRTMVSEDELVTPSPFAGSVSTQPKTLSQTVAPAGKARPEGSVSDPEVMLPGETSRKASSFKSVTAADLHVRDPEKEQSGISHILPKANVETESPGRRPIKPRPRSPEPKARNVYTDDPFSGPPKRSKVPAYLAVASVALFLGGFFLLYQQGGLPALLKQFSERAPAEGALPPKPLNSSDNNFKAPTSTADEKAKNEDQCIMKVSTDPAGANVIIDAGTEGEAKKGVTPQTFVLPCGATKNITIEKEGFQNISENLVIKKRTDEKYYTLTKIPLGVVRLILSQNANVWVDGQEVRYLPAGEAFDLTLHAGRRHKFLFKNEVLGINQEKEYEVVENETHTVSVQLEEKIKK
ncbi:MAG: serine/threonine protein kinase [Deltaproteobacteria bacterium]|nr:serine/threonine protein kinase [Deltaproteobacteria bacterium]